MARKLGIKRPPPPNIIGKRNKAKGPNPLSCKKKQKTKKQDKDTAAAAEPSQQPASKVKTGGNQQQNQAENGR